MGTVKDKELLKMQAQLKDLERKCALDQNRFKSYKERMNKRVDEIKHSLRKNEQEKEFFRYTKPRDDEQDEFLEHAYAQTFAQNTQLRDWLNSTNEKLESETKELISKQKQFDDYIKRDVEKQSLLVDATQKLKYENEQLRLQMAKVVRLQQAKKRTPVADPRKTVERSLQESLDEKPMVKKIEKESHKKKKKLKKEGKKKLKREGHDNKTSATTTKNVRTNNSDNGGLDKKMAPLASPDYERGFATDTFPQLNEMMEEKLNSELYCPTDYFIIKTIFDVRDKSYDRKKDFWRNDFSQTL